MDFPSTGESMLTREWTRPHRQRAGLRPSWPARCWWSRCWHGKDNGADIISRCRHSLRGHNGTWIHEELCNLLFYFATSATCFLFVWQHNAVVCRRCVKMLQPSRAWWEVAAAVDAAKMVGRVAACCAAATRLSAPDRRLEVSASSSEYIITRQLHVPA